MKQLSVILLLVVASALTLAQVKSNKNRKQSNAEIERLLLRFEDEWAQVDVTNDRSVFQRIIAPDFVSTSSRTGKIKNRQQWLADWEYEGVKQATPTDMQVHIFADNVAVVTGIDTTAGIDKGGYQWTHQDRCTDTWVKRNGEWQCVAAHCSRIK